MRDTAILRRVALRQPSRLPVRSFYTTPQRLQQIQRPPSTSGSPHGNFYKTHGRALFKALTLAFFSYQCFYWAWITLETEELKDGKAQEIKSLEREVRLLDEGRDSHKPSELLKKDAQLGTRLLEEKES